MTTELTMLALSIVLGLMHITIAAQASTRQRGADWNVGPRDEALPPLAGTASRLDRGNAELPRDLSAVRRRRAERSARRAAQLDDGVGRGSLFRRPRRLPLPLCLRRPVVRSLAWCVATLGIILILTGLI